MGKAQSKRSVDITTETNKGADDEVTEKMEKIEDTDRKEVNGDATIEPHLENINNDEAENDKHTTTDKNADAEAGGDTTENCKASITDATKEDGVVSEETLPLTDESAKKSKKEKVKKKWSLRSISFGKKDKQKPLKTEESTENAEATTNGSGEETPTQDAEELQKGNALVNTSDETSTEIFENGAASEQEKTEQQTEEKSPDIKPNEETANSINPIAEKSEPVINDTAENLASQETDTSSNIPPKSDVIQIESKSEENAANDLSKNGNEEINTTVHQSTNDDSAGELSAENKNIPADVKIDTVTVNGNVDDIHLNGSDDISDQGIEENKTKIEVNSNTDIKSSADTLEIISSSTYNNPSNVQVHGKHVNASCEILDDIGVEKNAQINSKQLNNKNADENDEKEINVEIVESNVGTPPAEEKIGHEPAPPPLPISPPPSHVSVFAFTNKEEPSGDSLENNEVISTQLEDYTNVIETSDSSSFTSSNPINHSEQHSIVDKTQLIDITAENNENAEDMVKNSFNEINTSCDEGVQNVDLSILSQQSCIESEIVICEKNLSTENLELRNVEKEIDIDLLKKNDISVISEINPPDVIDTMDHLKKTQQEETEICNNNEISENILPNNTIEQATELVKQESDDLNENGKIEGLDSANNLQNNSNDECQAKEDVNECKNYINSIETHTLNKSETDNDDCNYQFNTQRDEPMHDKTASDEIDYLVREETKELPNTKDLKECAAVAEVTQDPSITCE